MHHYCWELYATFLFLTGVFAFLLPPSSSASLARQNWCCRLTRETWTRCWDLWTITWRRLLWKRRGVVRIPTTTLRGPAPVRNGLVTHVRAPTVKTFFFFPPLSAEMLWADNEAGTPLVSLTIWWRFIKLNAVSSSNQQRDTFLTWSLPSVATEENIKLLFTTLTLLFCYFF